LTNSVRHQVSLRQHRRADGRLVQQGNQSPDDLKGLKMRIPGLGGDVMAKLGASPVSLPGSQIYENLVSGAVDATEWVGPYNDYFMKFYEAAKYYYYPGMHEPGSQLSMGFNMNRLLVEPVGWRQSHHQGSLCRRKRTPDG
jgi:hypothetical protein